MKDIQHQPIIRTDRLVLRQWNQGDLESYAKLNADPRVMEFFPATWTREESAISLQSAQRHIEKYGWGKWAVSLLETGEFIGRIGLEEVDFQAPFSSSIELGYRIAYDHWGKGYASEGAMAAMAYGFQTLHLNEVIAFTPVQNMCSRRIMEKLGMHHNPKDDFDHPKLAKGHPLRRHVLYRISQEEWRHYAPQKRKNGDE